MRPNHYYKLMLPPSSFPSASLIAYNILLSQIQQLPTSDHPFPLKVGFASASNIPTDSTTLTCVYNNEISEKISLSDATAAAFVASFQDDLYHQGSHTSKSLLVGQNPWEHVQIQALIVEFTNLRNRGASDLLLERLNARLALRTFLVGHSMTLADLLIWSILQPAELSQEDLKPFPFASRWYNYLSSLDAFQDARKQAQSHTIHDPIFKTIDDKDIQASNQNIGKTESDWDDVLALVKSQGSFDVKFPGLEKGKVVTRFPPEASGYLHVGHAKAALMNDFLARFYDGKLILRFDDTNPNKEKLEFEQSIIEDLGKLGVVPDTLEYTSDYFDILFEYAEKFIREGSAYADQTPVDLMREQRGRREENEYRSNSVERNLQLFEEMKIGSEEGLKTCLRAKIDMKHDNGALRDPIIYRCNVDVPHNRTGTKYKVYPTYDFSCPIVDSLEGVTHALRSAEYSDREPQYYWMCEAAGVRKPFMWNFSRLNFVHTVMSKRKLQWFVDQGHVSGWDDPRFPTVRGIRRRGLTIRALRAFILSQGFSVNLNLMQWDKLWAVNKRVIDPVAPRHTAINLVSKKIFIKNGPEEEEAKTLPKHKKNPEVGSKITLYAKYVIIEAIDAATISQGEIITLMDWGNVRIDSIGPDEITGEFLPDNTDFKKTKKFTWLALVPDLLAIRLIKYDHIITKEKVEEDDNIEDLVNKKSEVSEICYGDINLRSVQKGDIIQFERKGYYICDKIHVDDNSKDQDKLMTFIEIPDGKVKADSVETKAKTK